MGVRVPPRRSEKESTAIEKTMPLARGPEPSLPLSIPPSTPPSTNLEVTPESELSKGDGRVLESIKITAPGTYELNLPSLFEREELIMAVKEGTYFIDLTSAFKKSKKDLISILRYLDLDSLPIRAYSSQGLGHGDGHVAYDRLGELI
jgi:predicted  nucleic acid-binding Zn-ribbon protein